MNRQYGTRNQIFHRVYQTASFIKHQHLQGFKFNLNRAGDWCNVANTVASKSIPIFKIPNNSHRA